MEVLNRSSQIEKPNIIYNLGTGYYYYNYDIKEDIVKISKDINTIEEKKGYSYIPIRIQGKPDYNKCVKAVIRSYVSIDDELDLINTANLDRIKGIENKEYKEYLDFIVSVKIKIKNDFNKI